MTVQLESSLWCTQIFIGTGENYKAPANYTECQLRGASSVEECGLPPNYVSSSCLPLGLVVILPLNTMSRRHNMQAPATSCQTFAIRLVHHLHCGSFLALSCSCAGVYLPVALQDCG